MNIIKESTEWNENNVLVDGKIEIFVITQCEIIKND
jgi:hypothetical protein